MAQKVNSETSEKYIWGDNCSGWHLLKRDDLSVIYEEVPPGKTEIMHYHKKGRQFFYIIEGVAVMEVDEQFIQLSAGEGIYIEPGEHHRFRNDSSDTVRFLVVTSPKTPGDRVDLN